MYPKHVRARGSHAARGHGSKSKNTIVLRLGGLKNACVLIKNFIIKSPPSIFFNKKRERGRITLLVVVCQREQAVCAD